MNKIRILRKEKKLTQADLGKLINVSGTSIGFYENGKRDPDTETLKLLADFFDVSIDYLLGRSDSRNPKEIIYSNAFHSISTEGLSNEDVEALKVMVDRLKAKHK